MTDSLWFGQFAPQAAEQARSLPDLPRRPARCAAPRSKGPRGPALRIVWYLVSVSFALLLKAHYSTARPEDLLYVLGPTAALVGGMSGHAFSFESGVGYASRDALLAITKACAGVNYLIIAGLLLCSLWVPRRHTLGRLVSDQLLAWSVAYLCTLVINSVRVLMALAIHGPHRWEGTLLYFGSLLALGFAATPKSTTQANEHFRVRTRLIATATLLYLGVTLGLPLLRGALDGPDAIAFLKHSRVVLGITGAVATTAWVSLRHARTSPSRP